MPRQRATLLRSDFSKGLITEASNLTFPENASTDELNYDITNKKTRRKRNGFDLEESHVISSLTSTPSDLSSAYFSSGRWVAPGGQGNLEFASWQVGNKLYFFNTSRSPVQVETLTDTRTSTSTPIDMDDFNSIGSSGLLANGNPVTTATGNGFLFVAGEDIDPFYVKYDPETEEITSAKITLKIRDRDGVDDGLEDDERPTTLSDTHKYNLFNQGWFLEKVIEVDGSGTDLKFDSELLLPIVFEKNGRYPSNSDVWWTRKREGAFEAGFTHGDTLAGKGSTRAPRGHFILDAFYRDRAQAFFEQHGQYNGSNAGSLNISVEEFGPSRPTTVAFYAGRVWYGGQQGELHSTLFFSQVLESEEEIPKCYQQNDPTDEDVSQVVATDGGTIKIPEVAKIIKLHPFGEWLLVLASNGIWAIGGIEGQFKADSFRIKKVSSVNCLNPFSVVDARGVPLFWSDSGIYAIVPSSIDNSPVAENVSEPTIQTFYEDEIPRLSRLYATGAYDSIDNRVYWCYRSTATGTNETNFEYDKLLLFDLDQQAFYPWGVFAGTLLQGPHIAGIISLPTVGSTLGTTGVIDGVDNVIDGTDEVVVNSLSLTAVSDTIKFLIKKNPLYRSLNTTLSLTNMDFEDGSLTGWTATNGPVIGSSATILGTPKPADWGTYYVFFGNPVAQGTIAVLERDIDLSSLDSEFLTAIDAGEISVKLTWDQIGLHSGTVDDYDVRMQFKDSGGTVLDTVETVTQNVPNGLEADETLIETMPANTRTISLRWRCHQNDSGPGADYTIDNVVLEIADSTVEEAEVSSDLEVTFGTFRRTDTYKDFLSVFTNGKDYDAYLETGFEFGEEPITQKTAPFIYSFIKKETNASLKLQGKWDFSAAVDSSKWTKKNQVYRDLKDDRDTVITRTKIRGRGRSLKLRWEAESGKPSELVGWATEIERNTQS